MRCPSAGQVWETAICDLPALQWQPHALSRDERARVGDLSRYMGVAPERGSPLGCSVLVVAAHPTASDRLCCKHTILDQLMRAAQVSSLLWSARIESSAVVLNSAEARVRHLDWECSQKIFLARVRREAECSHVRATAAEPPQSHRRPVRGPGARKCKAAPPMQALPGRTRSNAITNAWMALTAFSSTAEAWADDSKHSAEQRCCSLTS